MKKLFILLIAVLGYMPMMAYDFEVSGIYYNITSSSDLTVEVTYYKIWDTSTYGYPYRCTYTGNIKIPETVSFKGEVYTVSGIGAHAFATSPSESLISYMSNLKSINLPSTIKTIGQCAFYMCDAIKTLVIPSSVTSIGNDSFNCRNCEKIIFLSDNPPAINSNGAIITGVAPNLLHIPCEIWVPNKKRYQNWDREKDLFWGGLVEMITPSISDHIYTGKKPVVSWRNNLKAYDMDVDEPDLQINAGNYSSIIKVNYYQNEVLAFGFDFQYEYTIHKVPLCLRVNDVGREYGNNNPIFTFSCSGFVNEEDEKVITTEPSLSTVATKSSNVGDYPITIRGGVATNYEFLYEPGVLTITKAPLSAKVNDATKVYGSKNPSFTMDYYGLKNDEIVPKWSISPTFQTDATQSSGVGQYEVKALNCVPVNYDLGEITSGTLNITPAPLTIKANDAARQYYSEEPNFNYTCSGFVNGENESVFSTFPVLSTSANLKSNVGTYEIKVSETTCQNYSISHINGTLTITPRTLKAFVGNYERQYNEDNPEFEMKYEGFVGGEDETVLNQKATASTTATITSDVGTYPIIVTGGLADNYDFTYSSGLLTINKAEQTISWEQDLSNLRIGDQVELLAVASSGLPISYVMENNTAAELYSAGNNRMYLDCLTEGQFVIRASQEGNNNYYPSTRINKTVTIGNGESSIKTTESSLFTIQKMSFGIRVDNAKSGEWIRIYSTDGILQKSIKAEGQQTDIQLSKGSVYIVKVGAKTVKLSL